MRNVSTASARRNVIACIPTKQWWNGAYPGERKTLPISRLQIPSFKIRLFWQEKRGFAKIISHFFSRFSSFSAFLSLQPVALQRQAAVRPLQKKSCLKHYRRFFVSPAMCHSRRMNVGTNGKTGSTESTGFRTRIHPFPILSKNLALFPLPKSGRRFVQTARASASQYR